MEPELDPAALEDYLRKEGFTTGKVCVPSLSLSYSIGNAQIQASHGTEYRIFQPHACQTDLNVLSTQYTHSTSHSPTLQTSQIGVGEGIYMSLNYIYSTALYKFFVAAWAKFREILTFVLGM